MGIHSITPTTSLLILSGTYIKRSISVLNTLGGEETTRMARPGPPIESFFPPDMISEAAYIYAKDARFSELNIFLIVPHRQSAGQWPGDSQLQRGKNGNWSRLAITLAFAVSFSEVIVNLNRKCEYWRLIFTELTRHILARNGDVESFVSTVNCISPDDRNLKTTRPK